ncbi:MAG: rhomboid family intramembrane serine protease [Phycisphaerales bacterium]|nr:rhomboid family intramembrane serine protease [Phycisphaerales bacterium]
MDGGRAAWPGRAIDTDAAAQRTCMGIYDREYARAGAGPSGMNRLHGWSFNTWLIASNVAVFVLAVLAPPLGNFMYEWGHFSTAKAFFMVVTHPDGSQHIQFGLEVWRFLTFQFLHANWLHLFFNMFALWLFGELVERRMGFKRYAAFYLACGIGGALMYLALNMLGNAVGSLPVVLPGDPRTPLVGASAGVFGVLMAAAFYEPRAPMQILFLPFTIQLRTLAYGYVALALLNLLNQGNNAGGDAAHIGGAIAGYFFVRRPHHLTDFFDVLGRSDGKSKRASKPSSRAGAPPRRAASAPPSEEVDRVLAKVSMEGLHSLSEREREILRRASESRR